MMGQVFRETGTIWENYAPDAPKPGKPAKGDFVGWSGIGPIVFLMEYAIGVRADAPSNTVTWNLQSPARVGIERLWFGGKTVSLLSEPPDATGQRTVRVETDAPFRLAVVWKSRRTECQVQPGAPLTFTISP
jgi:hypothetical protein